MNSSDLLTINCMRVLSMEAIQKANSGHPGITMGAAPMAYELWAHHMKHNPINPEWVNRDRFVLWWTRLNASLFIIPFIWNR